MKRPTVPASLLLLPLVLAACQMPSALRGSEPWPMGGGDRYPRDDWRSEGRYRQVPGPDGPQLPEPAPETALLESDPFGDVFLPQDPPLLAWDGGVVEGPREGAVREGAVQSHGIEPTIEGRMHIIELYQEVLDERDALLSEVNALSGMLEKTQDLLEGSLRERSNLEGRLSELEQGEGTLREQNRELAARLTTAQIRRLEAEKLLLESRIAWHRRDVATAVPVKDGGGR